MEAHVPNSDYEDTLVFAIENGKVEGYKHEFVMGREEMMLLGKGYSADRLNLVFQRRFEGMSNPADSMVYYQLETDDGKKGDFTSSYGPGGDKNGLEFIANVTTIHSR